MEDAQDFNSPNLQDPEHQEVAGPAFGACRMQRKNAWPNFFARLHPDCLWASFTQGVNGQREGLCIHLSLKGAEVLSTEFDDFLKVPF